MLSKKKRKPDFGVTVHCVDSYNLAHYLQTILNRIELQEKNYELQLDLLNNQFSRKLNNYKERYNWKIDNHRGHGEYMADYYHQKQDYIREKLALRQVEMKKAQQADRRKIASFRHANDECTPRAYSYGKQGALTFIEEFEEYMSKRNLPDVSEIRIHIFQHYLQGPAYEWIKPIIQYPQNYQRFYADFEAFLDEFARVFAGQSR